MNVRRQRIYEMIEEERSIQEAIYHKEVDDKHTTNDWIAILVRHLGLACNDMAKTDEARYRRQLIRVAATAIAALEANYRSPACTEKKIAGPTPEQRGSQIG